MIWQRFPQMPGDKKKQTNMESHSLCSWVLRCSISFSTLKWAAYNSSFTFTSCLPRPSRSTRGESLEPSQVFWACTLPWTYTWPSRFPGICGHFLKPLFPKASNSTAFLPRLFAPIYILCPGSSGWFVYL